MAQTLEIRVPNIGDFADVPIVEILVKAGDVVKLEDPLVAIESEKATMEVPSPHAGTVRSIAVKIGDKVSEGSALITLDSDDASDAKVAAPSNGASAPPPSNAAAATSTPTQALAAAPAALASESPAPAPALASASASSESPPVVSHAADSAASPEVPATNGIVHASPSIRRFSRELGVDLHAVRGSGPHGRITRDDVAGFVKAVLANPPAAATARQGGGGLAFDLPAWPKVDFAKFGPIEVVPLSRIRKLSGPNLHRNWISIPHVTNNDEADITDLEALRKALNSENPSAKVTMLAFIMKAVVVALRAHPDVNSSLDGETLVRKGYYNIGFAADTPQGLMVPVLHGADTKGVLAIATETAALAAKAREGKLGLAEMQGATFTISSLGGIGGTSFTPIVNAPEVAILGVSRSAIRPVWDGTAFGPRLMLPLSLSYDHRVIDGALAARFNATLAATLGDMRRALL